MTRDGLQEDLAALGAPGSGRKRAELLELATRTAVVRALDHAEVELLVKVLGRLPLALARCLKAANSPHFGQSRRIATATGALQVLGGRAVAMIVLAASYEHGPSGSWTEAQEALRGHSVRMSILAAQLCESLGQPQHADLASVAALLHDVHRLQPQSRARSFIDAVSFDAETDLQRSAALLRDWRLPLPLVDAVLSMESADALPSQDGWIGAVLRVAQQLADRVCEPVQATVEEIETHAAALQAPRSTVLEAMRLACGHIREVEGYC